MPKQIFNLDNLGDIDQGALRIAVNKALKLVTQDLADRLVLGPFELRGDALAAEREWIEERLGADANADLGMRNAE